MTETNSIVEKDTSSEVKEEVVEKPAVLKKKVEKATARTELKIEKNVPFIAQHVLTNIYVIGCGGTGSHVIPHLMRLIATKQNPTNYKITFVDGDVVEDKNLARQHFIKSDINKNKAEALAGRYSAAFGIPIVFRDKYIESEADMNNLLFGNKLVPLIISCVDNVKTRALIKDAIDHQNNAAYWIDCGNEDMAGQVVLSARVPAFKVQTMASTGNFPLPDVFEIYPDLYTKLKADKFASELSCAEMAVSSPQHGFVNLTAATLALNYIFPLLANQQIYSHVVEFSIKNKFAHRPINVSTIKGWASKSPIWANFDPDQMK